MEPANNIPTKIQSIFDKNVVSDLQRFMKKRQCLNETNMVFIYLFHIVQTAGILTTTIAAGNNAKTYIWLGIGLNLLASLINVFEQTNNNISKKLLKDIQMIKDGKYLDDGIVVEPEEKNTPQKQDDSEKGNTNLEQPLL
uniref:SMODS and SLOG-associating 2TM effector domain-containing protein n=1 Tax=viral metagenome TaxID=1070528 RepID=A0A6C0HCM8_9ZZZZ